MPGDGAPRRTYRIELVSGRILKGRIVTSPARAERMKRWLPMLPAGRFSVLLGVDGDATLESWIPGRPCRESDEEVARAAGRLLAHVHDTIERTRLSDDEPRLAAWCANARRWTAELRSAGCIGDTRSRRVLAHLERLRPAGATWGLRHGDFCADNLVHADTGLCCIDNATVSPGLLESDLAHTLYRWSMTARQREAFLHGYERGDVATSFLRHEDFWTVTAALRSGVFRLRQRSPAVATALALLNARVP